MTDPDIIRAEIEATRRNLGTDVDALADKVSPHQIAERQKEKVRGRLTDVRESIMGVARTAQDKASGVVHDVHGAGGAAGDRVSGAASTATETAKGHPLVVGLLAFGAGWLVSSLLPSSSQEQHLAGQVKEKAAPLADTVKEQAKNAGQEVAQHLKEPAQQAAEHVKGTAQDAAATVQEEGRSAAQDVKGTAQDAKDTVQGQAQSAKDDLQGQAQQARENLRS